MKELPNAFTMMTKQFNFIGNQLMLMNQQQYHVNKVTPHSSTSPTPNI
jgi:hypothetical protein